MNPTGGAVLGSRATALVTIADNALVQFQQCDVHRRGECREGRHHRGAHRRGTASPSSVRVTLGPPTNGVQLGSLATASLVIQDDDTPGAFKFPSGAARVHFDVPVLRDALVEGPETVNLALGATSAGSTLGARVTAVLTIVDGPAYTFAEIATTGDDGFRSLALPVINDAGVVAYAATLADGTMEITTTTTPRAGHRRVRDHRPGARVSTTPVTSPPRGTLADGRRGVFRVSATVVSIVALTGFASGEFRTFGSPSLNNRGDLVFSAEVIGGSDVLLRTTGDQLVTVADAGGNTFASFPPRPTINDAGVILFPTFLRSEEFAVFKTDDTLTPLADATLFDAEFQVRPAASTRRAGRRSSGSAPPASSAC